MNCEFGYIRSNRLFISLINFFRTGIIVLPGLSEFVSKNFCTNEEISQRHEIHQLKWQTNLDKNSHLVLGQEYFDYQIDDWWPGIAGSMMMGPNDYVNINNGKRKRIAAFAEYEHQIESKWWLNAGVRVENVRTDAGEVQPYNEGMSMGGMGGMSMEPSNSMAAKAFNMLDRKKTDTIRDARKTD